MSRLLDATRCPDCRAELQGTECPDCGLSLQGDLAARLWETLVRADGLVSQLREAALRPTPAPEVAGQATGQAYDLPAAGRTGRPVRTGRTDRAGSRLPSATVPVVLLAAGALLVAVAALVFGAVAWALLPEELKGLLLVTLAGGAGLVATLAGRRGLRIAAEVLWPLAGVVAATGLVLVLDDSRGGRLAAFVLVGLAAGATALRLRSDQPLPTSLHLVVAVALDAAALQAIVPDVSAPLLVAVVLGLGAAAVAAHRVRLDLAAQALAAGAAVAWVVLVLHGSVEASESVAPWWSAGRWAELAAATAIALLPALAPVRRRLREAGAAGAGAAATLLVLLLQSGPNAVALTAAAAALALAAGARTPHTAARGLLAPWAGLSAAATLGLLAVAVDALTRVSTSGVLAPSAVALPGGGGVALWSAPVLVVGLLAAAMVALPRHRMAALAALPGLAATAAVLVVAGGGGTVALVAGLGVAASLVSALSGVTSVLPRDLADRVGPLLSATIAAVTAAAVALRVAAASAPVLGWTALALAGLTAVASVLPLRRSTGTASPDVDTDSRTDGVLARHGRRLRDEARAWVDAAAAAATPGLLALGLVHTLDGRGGATLSTAVVATAAAGAVVLTLRVLGRPRWSVAAAGAVAVLVTLALAADMPYSSDAAWVLSVGGVAAVLAALLEEGEDAPTWVGSALLLAATGLRVEADVVAPEALSLSLGALLLVVGAWRLRRLPEASSLRTLGPGLTLALLPSLLLGLEDPMSGRGLLLVALALALLAWGALSGWSASLLAGAASLGLVALRLLDPVSSVVPSWVLAGFVGAALLAVGLTWETQRLRVDAARRYVRALR